MTISDTTLRYWAWRAERAERLSDKGHDEGFRGRAAQPMGRKWVNFNPGKPTVLVIDIDGRDRWITQRQEQVLVAAIRLRGRGQFTVTAIAASVGQSPSSVSRTLLKLASFGLISYDSKRGRYGGVSFIEVLIGELKERAQSAWERLKVARQKAAVRLWNKLTASGYFNVATNVERCATLNMDWEEHDDILSLEWAETRRDALRFGYRGA